MEKIRTPFQGLYNILRFNWHFYVVGLGVLMALIVIGFYFPSPVNTSTIVLCVLSALSMLITLIVSYYVYDASGLYQFRWLDDFLTGDEKEIVNIHAGFDETSDLIRHNLAVPGLRVFDFYDPAQHTEVSIRRARKAYPLVRGTEKITTGQLPLQSGSVDLVFLILAAHEIRNDQERTIFFRELHRAIRPEGKIIIVEHLRDLPNFMAYTIGFFHFLSRSTWLKTFEKAGLCVSNKKKINPFITLFILKKNDPAF